MIVARFEVGYGEPTSFVRLGPLSAQDDDQANASHKSNPK